MSLSGPRISSMAAVKNAVPIYWFKNIFEAGKLDTYVEHDIPHLRDHTNYNDTVESKQFIQSADFRPWNTKFENNNAVSYSQREKRRACPEKRDKGLCNQPNCVMSHDEHDTKMERVRINNFKENLSKHENKYENNIKQQNEKQTKKKRKPLTKLVPIAMNFIILFLYFLLSGFMLEAYFLLSGFMLEASPNVSRVTKMKEGKHEYEDLSEYQKVAIKTITPILYKDNPKYGKYEVTTR